MEEAGYVISCKLKTLDLERGRDLHLVLIIIIILYFYSAMRSVTEPVIHCVSKEV